MPDYKGEAGGGHDKLDTKWWHEKFLQSGMSDEALFKFLSQTRGGGTSQHEGGTPPPPQPPPTPQPGPTPTPPPKAVPPPSGGGGGQLTSTASVGGGSGYGGSYAPTAAGFVEQREPGGTPSLGQRTIDQAMDGLIRTRMGRGY